jgi:hypothetical protein
MTLCMHTLPLKNASGRDAQHSLRPMKDAGNTLGYHKTQKPVQMHISPPRVCGPVRVHRHRRWPSMHDRDVFLLSPRRFYTHRISCPWFFSVSCSIREASLPHNIDYCLAPLCMPACSGHDLNPSVIQPKPARTFSSVGIVPDAPWPREDEIWSSPRKASPSKALLPSHPPAIPASGPSLSPNLLAGSLVRAVSL